MAVVLVLGGCATDQGPGGGDDPEAVIGFNTVGPRTLLLSPARGGHLSSSFGPRLDPFTGELKFHEGIDLGAALESPIRAAGDGVVTDVGAHGGYGQYVRIRHDDRYETAYAHIGRYADHLESGQRVHKGDVIAYVGSTGRSTGPHLHYEILVDGHQVDPATLGTTVAQDIKGRAYGALESLSSSLSLVRDKLEAGTALQTLTSSLGLVRDQAEATGNDLLDKIQPTLATLGVSFE